MFFTEKSQLGLSDLKMRKSPQLVMRDKEVKKIVCGEERTFFLRTDGSLLACGRNKFGEIGGGKDVRMHTTPSQVLRDENVVQVECASYFSVLLMKCGDIWGCGSTCLGLLDASNEKVSIFTPKKLGHVENAKQIFCGNFHTLIIDERGSVFGFGKSDHSQLQKCGDLLHKIERINVREHVMLLMGDTKFYNRWSFRVHSHFEKEVKDMVFTFLLCLRTLPSHLKPPKPIFSVIINLTLLHQTNCEI